MPPRGVGIAVRVAFALHDTPVIASRVHRVVPSAASAVTAMTLLGTTRPAT
jgi:hypothetical protein